MKDLIIPALESALVILEKRVPQTKTEIERVSISDVSPLKITEFMKENNIPDTAYFDGIPNGYDGCSDVCLSWDIEVPTTDIEKLKFKRKKFSSIAFKPIHDSLIKNGYRRRGFHSGLLAQFHDTTVYDMFMNKEYDRLIEYYSLSFIKQ